MHLVWLSLVTPWTILMINSGVGWLRSKAVWNIATAISLGVLTVWVTLDWMTFGTSGSTPGLGFKPVIFFLLRTADLPLLALFLGCALNLSWILLPNVNPNGNDDVVSTDARSQEPG